MYDTYDAEVRCSNVSGTTKKTPPTDFLTNLLLLRVTAPIQAGGLSVSLLTLRKALRRYGIDR